MNIIHGLLAQGIAGTTLLLILGVMWFVKMIEKNPKLCVVALVVIILLASFLIGAIYP